MVPGMILGQVFWFWMPKHVKLALLYTIFKPVETYVDGFGAFFMDGFIGNVASSGFVGL